MEAIKWEFHFLCRSYRVDIYISLVSGMYLQLHSEKQYSKLQKSGNKGISQLRHGVSDLSTCFSEFCCPKIRLS